MKRRIFTAMALLATVYVLLVFAVLGTVFYRQISEAARRDIRTFAEIYSGSTPSALLEKLPGTVPESIRVTLIGPDGTVLYDSAADTEMLESHGNRAEVVAARENGIGESSRYSDTLREITYYYALRLDGGAVLRTAKTVGGIFGTVHEGLPLILLAVIVLIIAAYFVSGRVTARIIAPLLTADPEKALHVPYDELAPFVRTIEALRGKVDSQIVELREETDTTGAIMDNVSEGIVLIGGGGEILSINKSAAAIFELAEPAKAGNILDLMRRPELVENARAALAGAHSEINTEHGGRIFRAVFSPVSGRGAIILLMDITEKAQADQMRREFSANVSHELKTPLTSIYGLSEMLEGGIIQEADREAVYGKIRAESARLLALIEDIMLISELDERDGTVAQEDIPLAEVAAEVAEALRLKARERDVTVRLDGVAHVRASRSMMYEMLYNLLDNAIKYNVQGGGVTITLEPADGRARVTVRDTGIGIPETAQGRVFERFYRVDKSRSKKTGGTGLGLAIVKHIVLSHGGELSLKSRVGEGTAITVTI